MENQDHLSLVTTVILAGGQGSRLFPLTLTRCKPAVSFGGHYRLIDIPLSNSLNSKIHRMFVISQYFASDLQQHIFDTYKMDLIHSGGIEMLCPEETANGLNWFKGTADAVRQNMKYLLKSPVEYFMILSGDQLYNFDFRELLEFARVKEADLVVAALPVKEAEAKRMGLLKTNENALIVDFIEKPSDPNKLDGYKLSSTALKEPKKGSHYLGSMGIYVFKRDALIALLREEGHDFGKELIPKQVKKGNTFAYVYEGYWEDIGTIESFYHANLALLHQNKENRLNTSDEKKPIFARPHFLPSPLIRKGIITDSYIAQGAVIDAKEITNSVIGLRAHIKSGTVIRNSIILGNHYFGTDELLHLPEGFSVGENCHIEKTIIDEHAQIGNNVQLINKHNHQKYDGEGIYVRDGIIIVTSGTVLPDNFIF